MSRLQSNGAEQVLAQKLNPWLNQPPDYYDTEQSYKELGRLQAAVKLKHREITRAEETVINEQDKPRSNDARKAKLSATSELKDQLAELEAELAIADAAIKLLEFQKSMFSSAIYRTKMANDFA